MQEVFPESRAARSFPAGGTRWGAGGGRSGGAAASRRRWKPEREPRNSRQNAMHKVRAAVGFGGRPALRQDLPPGPTAGYGKPYVRWCGRVPGRNPRYPTRSSERPNSSKRPNSSDRPNSAERPNSRRWHGRLRACSTSLGAGFIFEFGDLFPSGLSIAAYQMQVGFSAGQAAGAGCKCLKT